MTKFCRTFPKLTSNTTYDLARQPSSISTTESFQAADQYPIQMACLGLTNHIYPRNSAIKLWAFNSVNSQPGPSRREPHADVKAWPAPCEGGGSQEVKAQLKVAEAVTLIPGLT